MDKLPKNLPPSAVGVSSGVSLEPRGTRKRTTDEAAYPDSMEKRRSTAIKSKKVRTQLPAPLRPGMNPEARDVRGPSHLIFSSLPPLLENEGNNYLAQQQPFFYLSDGDKFFVASRKYHLGHAFSSLRGDNYVEFRRFYSTLNLFYVHPFSYQSIAVDSDITSEGRYEGRTYCVINASSRAVSTKDTDWEQMSLAISEYCFRTGVAVTADSKVADSYVRIIEMTSGPCGNNEAVHFAAMNSDYKMFSYFLEKGADLFSLSDSTGGSAFDALMYMESNKKLLVRALKALNTQDNFEDLDDAFSSASSVPRSSSILISKKLTELKTQLNRPG